MPNWCENEVTVSKGEASEEDWKEFLDIMSTPQEGLFQALVPHPTDKEYDWYDWNITNWGTKWDVYTEDMDLLDIYPLYVTMHFMTAWSPPEGIYQKLVEKNFEVCWFYKEPGLQFSGWLPD